MVSLDEIIVTWKDAGLYSVLLPFLIVFAISFAVLEKSGILSNKKINVIVSAALGLFVVSNTRVIELINRFLPNIALFMVIILMFLLLIGMFGGGAKWGGWMMALAAIVSIVFVIWSLAADFIGTEWNLPSFWYGFDPATKTIIFFIAAIVVIIAIFMMGGESDGKGKGKGSVSNWFTNLGEEIKKTGK